VRETNNNELRKKSIE